MKDKMTKLLKYILNFILKFGGLVSKIIYKEIEFFKQIISKEF